MDTSDEKLAEKNNTTNKINSNSSTNMEDIKEFVKIGRTGRRNAVADVIADPNLNISTVNITELMLKISCNSDATTKDGQMKTTAKDDSNQS